ncbi:addiction module antidote protein, HigA family [Sinorhizobium meliloti]|uniref:HigA family addiction module antitoxin n=1 Tax=Rhizobium meliloti TaxID=382 RepID=UPI000FD3C490|nr:HigA family addiction module antitoxin [Sinorhizobium meliloti]RVH06281.1 addiction module antidote protein, HigA family [Sinorhizobium meliloti]
MSGATTRKEAWEPDWAIHPGEHLAEYIESRGWSQAEFARLADLTPKHVSTIINGTNPVTAETALKLERVLGMKASIWTGLQADWDLHQARQPKEAEALDARRFIADFPVSELKSRGVLPNTNDPARILDGLLLFYRIGTPHALRARLAHLDVHHRQSKAFETNPNHVAAWLLLGERRARAMDLPAFNGEKFAFAVQEIRKLTATDPDVFYPRMLELCRDAGVAFVLEKPISKTCLFGSARWIDGDRAIIQMSLRMKSNDHFWWTFFHEAAHVTLHRGKTFVDDKGGEGDGVEYEADAWAEDTLVGSERFRAFKATLPRSEKAVRTFASERGIHPGIVVGMLQHHGVIAYRNLNGLKARFDWKDD